MLKVNAAFAWINIGFFSLLALLSLIPLTSEWFDRKPWINLTLSVVTLIALAGLAVFSLLSSEVMAAIIFIAAILLNLVAYFFPSLVSQIKPARIYAFLLGAGLLILSLTIGSVLDGVKGSASIFYFSLSLSIFILVTASISLILQKSRKISSSLLIASVIPLLLVALLSSLFNIRLAFLLILVSIFILFSNRVDRTFSPTLQFKRKWIWGLSILLISSFLFLVVTSVVSALFLDEISSKSPTLSFNLTAVFSALALFFLLLYPWFIELTQKRINSSFSVLANHTGSNDKILAMQKDYFSSPMLTGLIQSLQESADKSQSLSKLREVLKSQTITSSEKQLRSGVSSLSELSVKLEDPLDLPVSAQFLVTILQKTINCGFAGVFTYNPDERRLIPLTIESTKDFSVPAGFRLRISDGLVSKAIRSQEGMIAEAGQEIDAKSSPLIDKQFQSFILKPLIREGYLEGLILLGDQKPNFFNPNHLDLVDIAGSQLLSAWSRFGFVNSVSNLIESSSALSNITELPAVLQKLVEISRQVMKNQFTVVVFSVQEKVNFTFHGKAPELRNSIEAHLGQLSNQVFRISESLIIRDCRRDQRTSYLTLDDPDLRTLLVSPIRIHGLNIGAFLFFGKRKGLSFNEQDSFIAGLIAMQSAALIEGCLLDQELRNNLISTQLLHGLNLKITQANDLPAAADAITETAYRLSQAESAGLVLYTADGKIETQSNLSEKRPGQNYPRELIARSMKSREIVSEIEGGIQRKVCFPILTSRRVYGGLWLLISEEQFKNDRLINEINNLVHQASIALERSILLKETREKADQVSLAYYQLQTTYDQTLMALVSAIDLRDRETEGHSLRVAQLALAIGNELELSPVDLKALERGSLLHDVGKIGISDAILHKPGPLTAEEWKIMRSHPEVGAQIIESIPFLKDAVTIVSNHQERWDGSGYPSGLKGTDIPILARIFSVADVFDALISDRPYHAKISPMDAMEYLKFQANILFDPQIIKIFSVLYERPNFLRQMGFYEI